MSIFLTQMEKMMLICQNLRARKRGHDTRKKLNASIEDTVDQLEEKHGNQYTLAQYRIWAETMENGQHSRVENPDVFSNHNQKLKLGLVFLPMLMKNV